jgi:hypothetical protein
MIDSVLKNESREIGVRVISYTIDKNKGLLVIAEWIKGRTK